jgi:ribosomal protein S18 acetylase RimI-like enzyme
MTIQILKFESRHLPTIVRFLNEEYRKSHEFIPYTEERILSQIRRRDLKILVAEENGNVLGLVGTHLEERGEENISWLAADEGPNRRIIENTLVNEVEKNAKGDTVTTTIEEGSPRINDWINRGYVLNPGWLRMSAKLDRLKPISTVAEGIKLRSLRPDEEEKLIEVVNTGFEWQRLEFGDLETWKSEDPPFNEDWVQVAEVDERIVSAVVAKPDTDYNEYLHLNRGCLGPAATLPEFRNKHLASALTAQAMNFLFEKGMNSVRLGTSEQNVSSITLLRSLGFQVDIVRKILRKKLKGV